MTFSIIWSTLLVKLCPALRVRSDSAPFYPVEQAAPRTARHLFAKATCKFSPENLWDKMPRRAFYPALQGSGFRLHCFATATPPFQSGLGSVCKSCKRLKLHLYNITEISFGRNGKRNMAENSFARSDRRERKSYYRALWIFRQSSLVVEPKTYFL